MGDNGAAAGRNNAGWNLDLLIHQGSRLRVELYIDIGDHKKNKRIFDELYARRRAIEAAVGETLSWERIDERRAARVALYHDGTISDSEAELAELRRWAVDAMLRLHNGIWEPAREVVRELDKSPSDDGGTE